MMPEDRWDELDRRVGQRYYGKYHGFVVDNQDPQRRGRLRLIVPEVLGEIPSGWAEPCVPYGGGMNFGNFDVPPITRGAKGAYTTGVWVEFRHGNPQFPIWVGCFYGAPAGEPEAPGDADSGGPSVDVHVYRSFSGHAMIAVDSPGQERLELRDTANQRISMVSPLREGVKRDPDGKPVKPADGVDYGDLAGDEARIEITDFAGNSVLLDATRTAPTVLLKNMDRDRNVLQTIELHGAVDGAKIVIRDNNQNVVTLDRAGIRIEALGGTNSVVMSAAGITADAPRVNFNGGVMGAARLNDRVASTITEDPTFWTWVSTLMGWLASHTHHVGSGLTTPPVLPCPVAAPTACTGKIVQSSETIVIGD